MNVLHADVLLTQMRYEPICDTENEGVMIWSDACKMDIWSLLREYLKTGKNASLLEKGSAGFQAPLSFF